MLSGQRPGETLNQLKYKHRFYIVHVGLLHQSLLAEAAFLLGLFLRQNMILEGALVLDLSRAGNFESLLRAGLRF